MRISKKWLYSVSALCLALVLQACGGGGGGGSSAASSASSSASTQLASGVVTGFGSVYVDGVEIEDANASVVRENYDGTTSNTVLQMGHRVRVSHNGQGTASSVTVDAAVIGTVSAISTATTPNFLTVAGQKVNVVTDSTVGTLTVWGGGYSSIADVVTGDLVEVHGTPVYDTTSQSYYVNATRIAKVTDSTGRMQVVGTISALDTTAKTFAVNGLTVNYASAVIRPSGATLADGTVVTVYAPLSSTATVTASHLKVNRLQDTTQSVTNAQISGVVSKYDSVNKTFEVQGTKVTVTSGTSINPNGSNVGNGAYVKVSGTVGTDGSITATNITVREQSTGTDLATVKLIGPITDFVDNTSFVVRSVPVDATNINVSESCPGVTLANGVVVTVTATQQAGTNVVLATRLRCQASSTIVIRSMDGTASDVDTTAKTFTLTLTSSTTTQAVMWNSNTTWVGVTSATLSGTTVRVEGYLSGTTLIARSIRASNSSTRLDGDSFRTVGNTSGSANSAWSSYRSRHR